MSTEPHNEAREALAADIKAAVADLADGRVFPDLLAAIDQLASLATPLEGAGDGGVPVSVPSGSGVSGEACGSTEPERCPYCDNTGDVHSADGEWRGECKVCTAASEPVSWQGLTEGERHQAVNDLVDYGTGFVAPLYAVIEGVERKLMERNAAPSPAPAPHAIPAQAGQDEQDAARWNFFLDNAMSMRNGERFYKWLINDGVWKHGSVNAAINAAMSAQKGSPT